MLFLHISTEKYTQIIQNQWNLIFQGFLKNESKSQLKNHVLVGKMQF